MLKQLIQKEWRLQRPAILFVGILSLVFGLMLCMAPFKDIRLGSTKT